MYTAALDDASRMKFAGRATLGGRADREYRKGWLAMRPDDGRINLWPMAVIGIIVILAAASITPVVRLNAAPPPDFTALRATAKGANAAEAARYWDAAVQVIEWKYERTSNLPEQAPAEFRPADDSGKTDTTARLAYWAKLREEWLKADNWHKTLTFNISWILNDAESIWRGIHDFVVDHT
jgi:hypothetical protein